MKIHILLSIILLLIGHGVSSQLPPLGKVLEDSETPSIKVRKDVKSSEKNSLKGRNGFKIVGLFKNKAIVSIGAKTSVISVGEEIEKGYKLISANSKYAIVQHNGKKYKYGMNHSIGTRFSVPTVKSVKIPLNAEGQYITDASFNKRAIRSLFDTGANITTLSSKDANKAGIDYIGKGRKTDIVTASEKKVGYTVVVEEVAIGVIVLKNIEVTVIEGDFPEVALIGMSFLKDLHLNYANNILELKQN